MSNLQQELLQPAIFIDKNGILFRKVLCKWNREIEVGKTMNYDMDSIEKMNERLIQKQKKYEKRRRQLGIRDNDPTSITGSNMNVSDGNINTPEQTNLTQNQQQPHSSQQQSNSRQQKHKYK